MAESFAELLEQTQADRQMRPGTIVTGTVVEVRPDGVVVYAGFKSEGVIPLEQFRNELGKVEVNVGDRVDVALDAIEDGFGARTDNDRGSRLQLRQIRRNVRQCPAVDSSDPTCSKNP